MSEELKGSVYTSKKMKLCSHLKILFEKENEEYFKTHEYSVFMDIECLVCKKTFEIEIGIN